jgi:hypothetical protein
MSTPVVHQVRLAFIWFETTLELLRDPVKAAPFAFLGSDATFVPRFRNLQQAQPDPDALTLPWPKPSGQRFWTFYLKGTPPGKVNAGSAWGALVPFRLKLDTSVSAAWLPGRVVAEGYFYPHGHALVVTFEVSLDSTALAATVELARDLRSRRKLMVTWSQTRSEELILDAFAESALALLRERALGKGAAPGAVAAAPFSVVTFVKIDGVDPMVALPEGGEIHRALEAVTGWHGGPLADLPPLPDSVINPKATHDVVYAKRRARAIWFPYFATTPGLSKLGCYGRNLMFASLQVESAARLVVQTLEQGFLSDTHRDLARYAGGLLGRVYGRDATTYNSASCRLQLEQNDWLDPIDEMRQRHLGMPILQRTKLPDAAPPSAPP